MYYRYQMQWTMRGAHLLLQTRTQVPNGDHAARFRTGIPASQSKMTTEARFG